MSIGSSGARQRGRDDVRRPELRHEARDVGRVEWLGRHQPAQQDGPCERLGQETWVRVGRQLAGPDAFGQEIDEHLAPGAGQPTVELAGIRITFRGVDQRREARRPRGGDQCSRKVLEQHRDLRAHVAFHRYGDRRLQDVERVADQRVSIRPVAVDGALRDAGSARDRFHRHRAVAALDQERDRGVEHHPPRALDRAGPANRARCRPRPCAHSAAATLPTTSS